MRKIRKDEHIRNYLKTEYVGDTLFNDVFLEHNSLPDIDFDEVDTSVEFLGKRVEFPMIINSMTGGTILGEEINEDLSYLAKEFGLPMAVGSQTIALDDKEAEETLKVVRDNLDENNIVIANLGSNAKIEDVRKALDMIYADALAIHLNPAQELFMQEGDRNFKGVLSNIKAINKAFPGKIMVKEVGYGLSKENVKKLFDNGINIIDISGHGGTNFTEIEDMRDNQSDFSEFYSWGIPTAKSIIDARSVSKDITLIGSGGIKTALDLVKAIVLGADITGVSGELLRFLVHGDYEYASMYLESLIYKTKLVMILLGVKNIEELKKVPYKTTGRLRELLD